MLEVCCIVKRYGNESVLDGVSFQLAAGEALLLLGENGAGKSTLLLVIAGLLRPQQGKVILDGHNVYQDFAHVKGRIAHVPQEPALIHGLTVQDNLLFWAGAAGLSKSTANRQMQYLVQALGLGPVLKKKASKLSGGMKKRLSLASSLFCTPLLLLLDEPFANVDSETKTAIYRLLASYKKAGCAMIIVSHMDETARRFADCSLTLQGGKLSSTFLEG